MRPGCLLDLIDASEVVGHRAPGTGPFNLDFISYDSLSRRLRRDWTAADSPVGSGAHWANFHCNEAYIIAKVPARRESLHFFDDLLTQLKSG